MTRRLLMTGGSVIGRPGSSAVLTVDGRIEIIGSDDQARAAAGGGVDEIDISGGFVGAGLIDSHCHFEDAAMDDHAVRLSAAATIDEALDLIARFAVTRPDDAWIRGQTWNPVLQLAERRPPTRHELDEAAAGRPVVLREGHGVTASTAALRAAGLEHGGTDGHLVAPQMNQLLSAVPAWTRTERRDQLSAAMALLNRHGITSVVGGAMAPDDLVLLRELATEGKSTVRVAAMVVPTGELVPSGAPAEWADSLGSFVGGDDRIRVRGVKLQVDGGMTLGSALTRDPYEGRPDHRGSLAVDPAHLRALVAEAHRAGWPVGLHVVGDAGVDLALDVLSTAPVDTPDVLIHASLMTSDQIERAAAMPVVVAGQTPFLWRNRDAIVGHLGEERLRRAVPFRDWIDGLGVDRVAAGTDHPINALDPFANLYAMTTRRDLTGRDLGSGQVVTAAEAWSLYTSSGAAHTGEEGFKGTLVPGAAADLVVLNRDPTSCSPDELLKTVVDLTVVDGDVVHTARRAS